MQFLDSYQADAIRTAKFFPTIGQDLAHVSLGLITEFGEIAAVFGGPDAGLNQSLSEETGDLCWYIALGCHVLGVKMSQLPLLDGPLEADQLIIAISEFASVAKRAFVYNKELDINLRARLVGALGAILTTCMHLGMTEEGGFEAVLNANIDKLRKRFPDAYSDAAAEARADKGGLGPEVS